MQTTAKRNSKLMLRACPRCQGDLFPDLEDEDLLACLQCGRRIPEAQIIDEEGRVLVPAA